MSLSSLFFVLAFDLGSGEEDRGWGCVVGVVGLEEILREVWESVTTLCIPSVKG